MKKKTYGSRRDVIFEADLIPVVIAMKIKKQDKALPCQRKKGGHNLLDNDQKQLQHHTLQCATIPFCFSHGKKCCALRN
jgi:hypothetical protein